MNDLTSEEITGCVRAAYPKLSEHDQDVISRVAKGLIKNMKKKHPKIIFGPDSALELLAALGIAFNDERLRFVK